MRSSRWLTHLSQRVLLPLCLLFALIFLFHRLNKTTKSHDPNDAIAWLAFTPHTSPLKEVYPPYRGIPVQEEKYISDVKCLEQWIAIEAICNDFTSFEQTFDVVYTYQNGTNQRQVCLLLANLQKYGLVFCSPWREKTHLLRIGRVERDLHRDTIGLSPSVLL